MLCPEIDHLVFVADDLASGMHEIEDLLGVPPEPGGRHPDFGTHNALVSLGPGRYLEILAPDPTLEPPERGRLTDVWGSASRGLFTWVARLEHLERVVQASPAPLGEVRPCSRMRPDGTWLFWTLSDPFIGRQGGPVPFLIDWGDTSHPSDSAPEAGRLTDLRLFHPEPERVERILRSLGMEVRVERREQPGLQADIQTSGGRVTLS